MGKKTLVTAAALLLLLGGWLAIGSRGGSPSASDARADDKGGGDVPAVLPPDCEPNKTTPGKVVFDLPADILDIGGVKQGETLERDIVVQNKGTGLLCVREKPRTGCGCVQAEWVGEMRLRPEGSGIVRVRVDTKGREGPNQKDVTVVSNDPDRPEAVFHVKFEVKLGVLVAKSANVTAGSVVYFGRHAPGKPGTAVVRLKSPLADPEWKVTAVEGTKTKFTWTVAPAEPNDPIFRQFDVTITHPGSDQLDLNDESLKILTTHPDRPEILLHSQLLVANKYYTSPPIVRFGFVGGTSSVVAAPRMVTVFPGEEGTTFQVTKVEVEGAGFTVGLPVDRGADGWQVEVRYDEQKRGKGPVDAKLILHIADPDLPVIEVPLHAEVRD